MLHLSIKHSTWVHVLTLCCIVFISTFISRVSAPDYVHTLVSVMELNSGNSRVFVMMTNQLTGKQNHNAKPKQMRKWKERKKMRQCANIC